jgi:hypothetical protein
MNEVQIRNGIKTSLVRGITPGALTLHNLRCLLLQGIQIKGFDNALHICGIHMIL